MIDTINDNIRYINLDRFTMELSLKNIVNHGGTIFDFLQFLEFSDIIVEIEKEYKRKPQFHVKGMMMLAIAYHSSSFSYSKLLDNLTIFDISLLKFNNRELPSKSILNDFILHRVGEELLEKIMRKISWKLYHLFLIGKNKLIGNEDSTPIEASRYDMYAKYNPHYRCKMYKAHITMFETVPLYMSFTDGLRGDNPESIKNMKILNEIRIKFDVMNKDGGYDSFENYADTKMLLGANPNINPPKNSIINNGGSIEGINHTINKSKFWKQGLSNNDSIKKKLEFFYNKGKKRKEQVGMYLRNQVITNGLDKEAYPLRSHQERIHDHIKQTVKFDVRRVHTKQKKQHILWSFISYQMLCLTALQNGLNPNEFGFIS